MTKTVAVAIALLALSLLSLNVAPVNGQTPRVMGHASATGELTVVWTNNSAPFVIAEGSGSVVMNVQGEVVGGPNIYYFTSVHVSVVLQAYWGGSDGTTYSLMAKVTVPLSMASRGTLRGDAHPDGTFVIGCCASFHGLLTANTAGIPLEGNAKVWALTPAHSFQAATSNYLTVELNSGSYSFTIGWSESAQTVGGIPLPQADHYFQRVQVIT